MKKYRHMKGHKVELKTVHFIPKHYGHEEMEHYKEHHKGCPFKGSPKPEPFTKKNFEERGKELEKTNKVTGLWYPHKGKE